MPFIQKIMMMNTLNNFFSKIYCINLDKRTDRWEQCMEMFSKYNLQVERVSAFEPNVSPICCISNEKFSLIRTHREIIKIAKEEQLENILIFEDDVEFCDFLPNYTKLSFEERFNKSISFLPQSWDVLYLGCGNYTNNRTPIGEELYKIGYGLTTHAIAINKRFYDTILHYLESPIQELDVIYCELLHKHNCYSFYPNLVSQRPSYSDIENKFVSYDGLRDFF